LVVDSQEGDYVAYVVRALDSPGCESGLPREDRVVVDPALIVQLVPHGFGKAEVEDVVAVQVAELPAPELEGEGAAIARAGRHARPGGELLGDLLARCVCPSHLTTLQAQVHLKSRIPRSYTHGIG